MRTSLASLLLLLLASSLPAQASIRLEPSATSVRSGDTLVVDVFLDNPNGLTFAGYQVLFGWNAESLAMAGAPTTLPNSVLVDLFSSNAPPPFGNGFNSCPSASDGVAQDAIFALSVALTAAGQFSGPTGHLFQVSFVAQQATSHDPALFVLDEFSGCIGQQTILSDPSGVAVAVTLLNTAAEVTPNLRRLQSVPIPGGIADFELHDEPGLPYTAFAGLFPDSIDYGPVGMLFVNTRQSFMVIGQGSFNSTGSATLVVGIPPIPMLQGRTVYAQAVTGSGNDRRLSNLVQFGIQ